MPISPPLDRVLTSAIWCGVVCYVLTWLLHLWLKMFLRAASPFVIEGTVAAVCGGGLGVLAGVYLGKTVSRPWLRVGLCMGVMTLIPFVVVSAGVSGMIGTGWLINSVASNARCEPTRITGLSSLAIRWGCWFGRD